MGWYSTAKFKGQRARNKVKKAAKPVGGFLSAVKTNIVIAGEQSGTLPRGKFRKIKVVKKKGKKKKHKKTTTRMKVI